MKIEPKATHTTPEHEVMRRAIEALAEKETEREEDTKDTDRPTD